MKKVLFTNDVTKETKVVYLPEDLFLIDKLLEELTQTKNFYEEYGDDDSIWNQGYEYLTDTLQKKAFELFGIDNSEFFDYIIELRNVPDENYSDDIVMNATLTTVKQTVESNTN